MGRFLIGSKFSECAVVSLGLIGRLALIRHAFLEIGLLVCPCPFRAACSGIAGLARWKRHCSQVSHFFARSTLMALALFVMGATKIRTKAMTRRINFELGNMVGSLVLQAVGNAESQRRDRPKMDAAT
jgi:hypothetical protein